MENKSNTDNEPMNHKRINNQDQDTINLQQNYGMNQQYVSLQPLHDQVHQFQTYDDQQLNNQQWQQQYYQQTQMQSYYPAQAYQPQMTTSGFELEPVVKLSEWMVINILVFISTLVAGTLGIFFPPFFLLALIVPLVLLSNKSKTKKNWAKANLIITLVSFVIAIILVLIFSAFMISFMDNVKNYSY